ncbi:CCA tRNA nucleotidyltransferase [Streptococcus henryi]|uniref:CCA tRNA nucleotidyltransferase n=1 Tax=Streptococcus henryi TaxID=439219 RepID=UPI0003678EF3|nr:CCA tRNA nucleotidyltransferase [Streptococcus henryi]
MKLNNLPSEFQKALPILKKIRQAGYEAYFVGGSVRDAILNRPIHDVDIATSSYPEETKQIFNRTVDIGIEHGTVLVLETGGEYEITTFRTEDVYVDYRRPQSVSFVRSLDEDLKRRDFTVNAFALDETGTVIDKFNGLDDLNKHLLRAVGVPSERFNEDALRIMRGFRFAATLDFTIETETFEAMKSHAPLLEKISVERSFIEFDKLLLAPFWKKGLSVLIDSGAYDYLPDLADSYGKLQSLRDCFSKDFCFASSEQAWAALLLALDVKDPKEFLKKWKTSSQFQKDVSAIVAFYRYRLKHEADKPLIYKFGKECAYLVEGLRQAQGLSVNFERIEQLDQELTIHDKHEIVVNGGLLIKELGMKPGPKMGKLLKGVEEAIVLGDLANNKADIFNYIKEMMNV